MDISDIILITVFYAVLTLLILVIYSMGDNPKKKDLIWVLLWPISLPFVVIYGVIWLVNQCFREIREAEWE